MTLVPVIPRVTHANSTMQAPHRATQTDFREIAHTGLGLKDQGSNSTQSFPQTTPRFHPPHPLHPTHLQVLQLSPVIFQLSPLALNLGLLPTLLL